MMPDPHSLIEGVIIASLRDPGQPRVHLHPRRGGARRPAAARTRSSEAYAKPATSARTSSAAGFDLDLVVHSGAGAYICGEETALLDSLEGYRGQPRLRPPFPATHGLYACPTVVNNVETIASVPYIVLGGSAWFRSMGTEKSPGPKIYSLSGRVNQPRPVRVRARHHAAGAASSWPAACSPATSCSSGRRAARRRRCSPPSTSTCRMDFEGDGGGRHRCSAPPPCRSSPTRTDLVYATYRWIEFYHHESCGKCTPCREGNYWMVRILHRILSGQGTARGPRHPAGHLRQPARPLVLRARRRRDQPGDVVDQVLQAGLPGLHRGPQGADASSGELVGAALMMSRSCRSRSTRSRSPSTASRSTAPKGALVIRAAERLGIDDPPLLRPPAAGPGRRLPAVPGRRRGPAQAGRLVHPAGRRRHGGAHPAHLPGRREGAGGHHGVAADQPPARLPDVRQGRRVPAAEPGDVAPAARDAGSTSTSASTPSRSTSRTQVLLDRERCVLCQRCTRFSDEIAGDKFIDLMERSSAEQIGIVPRQLRAPRGRRRPVQLLLLRQHDADLPGRRADQRAVPVPGPAVRPGLHAERVRALRGRLRPAHRPPPRQGACAGWPATTRRSTRSGTATRAAGASSTPPPPTG